MSNAKADISNVSKAHSILPDSLLSRVQALAQQEGISPEEFIRLAVAEKTAVLERTPREGSYMDLLAARAERRAAETGVSPRERLQQILDKAPDVEPAPEDRLPEHLREEQ